jgi:hypothetical protein
MRRFAPGENLMAMPFGLYGEPILRFERQGQGNSRHVTAPAGGRRARR